MKQIWNGLKQIAFVFLIGILFLTASFGAFGGSEAIANPVEKPQATTYDRGNYNNGISEPGAKRQVNYSGRSNDSPPVETQEGLKGAADNVREKLNLDQPIYPGTKEFISDVKEKVEDTVEGAERAVGR